MISNNHAFFHLWWKENLAKRQKVSKYYENDCRYVIWNTAKLVASVLQGVIAIIVISVCKAGL